MIVYRITLPQFKDDFSGTGAALYGGRWNSIGNFMLYTAETSSLSMLEHLVHIEGADSIEYVMSLFDTQDSNIFKPDILPSESLSEETQTARMGDMWLKKGDTPIMQVPSVINPLEHNFLINPSHPKLKLRVLDQRWMMYDRRLVTS